MTHAIATPERLAARRAELARRFPHCAFVLLAAAPPVRRPARFRQDADLLYLSGIDEPSSALVLAPGPAGPRSVLFVRERDAQAEQWGDPRLGLEAAAARAGLDEARPWSTFAAELPALLGHASALACALGRDAARDLQLVAALVASQPLRARLATGCAALAPHHRRTNDGLPALIDARDAIGELRLRKDPDELAWMRRAGALSAEVHTWFRETAVVPGARGRDLAAALEAELVRRGLDGPAFAPIVALGDEGCCLHPAPSERVVEAGELVLVDAGGELGRYAADLTRTFAAGDAPMSSPAATLHAAVLAAQQAAIAAARPGSTLDAVHLAACAELAAAQRELGLPGPLERWFPHPTSHSVGLDVHDSGRRYLEDASARPLEPGMVFTVEPGLYVPSHAADAPAALRGLAVRIEDTVLVGEQGPQVLTR